MPFTHPWDNTTPLDTQLAKLLGQNIRDLKTDTQERFRQFSSGLIAQRPTPDAGFGDANNGILYYAKDEGKSYVWNGSAWSLQACNTNFFDLARTSVFDPGTGQPSNQIAIPANFLVPGMSLSAHGSVFVDGAIGSAIPATQLQLFSTATGWQNLSTGTAPAAGSGGNFNVLATFFVCDPATLIVSGQAIVTGRTAVLPNAVILTTVDTTNIIYIRTAVSTAGATSGCHFTGFGLVVRVNY